MPLLSWAGKEKVVNHHNEVAFHVLERKWEVGEGDNMIVHGDNLLALKALLPQYEGRIKCIYIDPPYNTGNEAGREAGDTCREAGFGCSGVC